jgi:hypothetical protein
MSRFRDNDRYYTGFSGNGRALANQRYLSSPYDPIPLPKNEEPKKKEERTISTLITIDYNESGDWRDEECVDCGMLNEYHTVNCSVLAKGWEL